MKTPPDRPFDPDDPNLDPWADDPNAPKEPGLTADDDPTDDLPWSDDDETPDVHPPAPSRGPAGLLDSGLRGEIEFEILFQQTKAELLKPPAPPGENRLNAKLLAVSLVLFVASFWITEGPRWVGFFLGVVALHELGHLAAMRAFGSAGRLRAFVPFFDASTTGRDEETIPAKRLAADLVGPLPGVFLGAALYFGLQPAAVDGLFSLALLLVFVNALNLLPVVPLDGGRVLDLLFFARRPWTGTVVRALTVGGLVGLGVWVEDVNAKLMLGLLGTFVLLIAPLVHRQARHRRLLSRHFPDIPADLAAVPNDTLRRLFGISLGLAGGDLDPETLAPVVRNLHAKAVRQPIPPAVATAAAGFYALGCAVALVALLAMQAAGP